jgi:hypothetical protein
MLIAPLAWSIEVGTAVAWLSLLVSSYLAFLEYRKRPRLSLKLDVRDQIDTKLPEGDIATLSRWVRVRVLNKNGRRVAKNCRAFLIGMQRINADGSVERIVADDCRHLPWMNDDYKHQPRDLFPGVANWIDLYYSEIHQPSCFSVSHPRSTFKAPGEYRLAVQISAEEANAPIIYLRLSWGGKWESLKVVEASPGTWVSTARK